MALFEILPFKSFSKIRLLRQENKSEKNKSIGRYLSELSGNPLTFSVACSVGVFFGRANVLLAKAHVETRKEGRKWGKSMERGSTYP